MKDTNIYTYIWGKYRPAILSGMRKALETPFEYKLSHHEFEAIGDRLKSGYAFNLELEKGIVTNSIKGKGASAVARDLLIVLKESKTANELMNIYHFKINLGKDFILQIQTYN